MQQQYVRLTEDHQKIVNGQKEDFERLKDTKEKESKSLQGSIFHISIYISYLILLRRITLKRIHLIKNTPFQLSGLILEFFETCLACVK